MDTEEKYLFDLMGFLVVKQVLSRDEVDELNALIDSYDLWRKAESGQEAAWLNDPNFMTVGVSASGVPDRNATPTALRSWPKTLPRSSADTLPM